MITSTFLNPKPVTVRRPMLNLSLFNGDLVTLKLVRGPVSRDNAFELKL